MGIKFKKLRALVAMVLLTACMSVTAFAAPNAYEEYLNGTISQLSPEVVSGFLDSGESGTVSRKDYESVKKLMVTEDGLPADSFASCSPQSQVQVQAEIKRIADKSTVKTQISTIGTNFDMTADVNEGTRMLSGFLGPIQSLLGVLVVIVTVGMTVFSALDICYITIPVFRNKCEDMKSSGSAAMSSTNAQTGETKFRWVTDEAIFAVKTCSVDTGKNPLGVYLKKRILAYILLGIVLYILFTGNIGIIVNLAVNLVGGIMASLAALGA